MLKNGLCIEATDVTIQDMLNIREIREELGVSQAQFSEMINMRQYRLSSLELGKEKPLPDEIERISKAFDEIRNGLVAVRKKKRISKEKFSSSIVADNPRRGYVRTPNNEAYLQSLRNLELEFNKKRENCPIAISFFAGCGGLCYGITAAGFKIVASNELEEDYKAIYRQNFPDVKFLANDIKEITDEEIDDILKYYPEIDLFAGGPPCQGFSLAGKRDISDKRNTLFSYYLKIANKVKPKVILMENVRLLTSMKNPDGKFVKDDILNTFAEIGYNSRFFIVNAADYGVAQNRERVIFIGIRKDLNLQPVIADTICGDVNGLFAKQPYFTFGDAVSDLEFLEAGEKSKSDKYHKAVAHPEHVIRWLYNVPEGKSAHDNEDPSLRPPSGYNTTYKRQVWNEPGATVQTTFGMISGSNNVHPIATRSLTIREAMRLQSFPDSFKIEGKDGVVRTTIGNAVPPLLAYRIALFIKSHYIDHQ